MGALNAGSADESPPLPDESPFQPGTGTAPPALGGRRAERDVLLHMLRSLASGQKPKAHPLLFGPRGSGKTVLLNWLADAAAQEDCGRPIDVVRLGRRGFASQTALAQALSSRSREAVTTTTAEGGLETRAGLPGILDVKGGSLVYTAKQTEWRELTTDEVLQDRTLGADGDARALLVILDELHEVPTQCADAPGLEPLGRLPERHSAGGGCPARHGRHPRCGGQAGSSRRHLCQAHGEAPRLAAHCPFGTGGRHAGVVPAVRGAWPASPAWLTMHWPVRRKTCPRPPSAGKVWR